MTSIVQWMNDGTGRMSAGIGGDYAGAAYPSNGLWCVVISAFLSPNRHPIERSDYASEAEAKAVFEGTVPLLHITKRIMS